MIRFFGTRRYDFTPARLDFCNWSRIKASYLSVHTKKLKRGGGGAKGRDKGIEDRNKTPFVVLVRRDNERPILLRANKKSFLRRQLI